MIEFFTGVGIGLLIGAGLLGLLFLFAMMSWMNSGSH